MGIIDTNFTMPGNDSPPQTFRNLKTQQGQINWLAQFLMSVNNVFDNVSGSVTTLAEDQSAYVEIDFDDENNTTTFDFFLPRGYRGYPGSMESVTATAQTLAPGSSATVSVTLDQPTQSLAFSFGLPEGTPATDAQTAEAVADWIEAHPEAVTTVQDGAVSTVKLADGAVTFAKLASDVKAILAGKADLVSYAPLITAGVAESLLARDEQQATFAVHESAGASVGVHAILGNTQIVDNEIVSVNIEGLRSVGFNQWDEVWENGDINSTGGNGSNLTRIRSKNFISCEPNTDYYINTSETAIYFYTATKAFLSSYNPSVYGKNFTTPPNAYYMRFYTGASYGSVYNNDICINVSDPSRNDTYEPYQIVSERAIDIASYFPYGLRGAGTAHDAIYRDHAETVIGVTPLSTQPIQINAVSTGYVFRIPNFPMAAPDSTSDVAGIFIPGYTTVSANYLYGHMTENKLVSVKPNNEVWILDNDYSTVDGFIAANVLDTIQYALSTPTITQLDPPINMDCLTQAGGTEQIVIPSNKKSVAPTFVYVHGYDADGVADKALSVIAAIEGAKASTNYAIGSYFVYDGKLYKATSAIASGESITPGTNCTQTTVMAEILALA